MEQGMPAYAKPEHAAAMQDLQRDAAEIKALRAGFTTLAQLERRRFECKTNGLVSSAACAITAAAGAAPFYSETVHTNLTTNDTKDGFLAVTGSVSLVFALCATALLYKAKSLRHAVDDAMPAHQTNVARFHVLHARIKTHTHQDL
ncbi:hypothetical protein [Micavibrio aeruginosavorus]|uniref:hypothetical protein n=1 Tax=Micavibrio aeruginosavorus TaxID=349221 RepID=UPI003F4AE3C9